MKTYRPIEHWVSSSEEEEISDSNDDNDSEQDEEDVDSTQKSLIGNTHALEIEENEIDVEIELSYFFAICVM